MTIAARQKTSKSRIMRVSVRQSNRTDIMSPTVVSSLVFLLVLFISGGTEGSITFEANGYGNVVIAISPSLPGGTKSENNAIIEGIQVNGVSKYCEYNHYTVSISGMG
jgi:hypothetical protein